jgi:hypothetical protein
MTIVTGWQNNFLVGSGGGEVYIATSARELNNIACPSISMAALFG